MFVSLSFIALSSQISAASIDAVIASFHFNLAVTNHESFLSVVHFPLLVRHSDLTVVTSAVH